MNHQDAPPPTPRHRTPEATSSRSVEVTNIALAVVIAIAALLGLTANKFAALVLFCAAALVWLIILTPLRRWKHLQIIYQVLLSIILVGAGLKVAFRPAPSVASSSNSRTTSHLEITAVTGGPNSVPCKATVWGQGTVPQGMIAVIYALDQNSQSQVHWFEPVTQFKDGDPTHWWTEITLQQPKKAYTIGAILLPARWANYLSTAEKYNNNSNTYWASPGLPPESPPNEGDQMQIKRSGRQCVPPA
jgi:hypothetical protein